MNDAHWIDLLRSEAGHGSADGADSALARAFAPLLAAKREGAGIVVTQLGQSLDGRIATATGSSRGINGPAAMTHLHRLRALVDAVVVGAATARIDDPRLTVRHCSGKSPARVVIDPRGTVRPDAQVWRPDDGARRLVFGGRPDLDASVERLGLPAGAISPAAILATLNERGMSRILIEGGGKTVSHFISAGIVDYLHLLVAPVILGSGLVGLSLPGIDRVETAIRPAADVHVFEGGDVLFACRLRSG